MWHVFQWISARWSWTCRGEMCENTKKIWFKCASDDPFLDLLSAGLGQMLYNAFVLCKVAHLNGPRNIFWQRFFPEIMSPNCKNASLPLSFDLGWKLAPSSILQLGTVDVSGHGVCWSSLCALVSRYVTSHRPLLKGLLKSHIIYGHVRYFLFTNSFTYLYIVSSSLYRSSFYFALFISFQKWSLGGFVKPRRRWACAKVLQTRPRAVECPLVFRSEAFEALLFVFLHVFNHM